MLKLGTETKKKEREKTDKGFLKNLWNKGVSFALKNLLSRPEPPSLDNCKVNCNSLLYKIQYSDQLKSRDMVL